MDKKKFLFRNNKYYKQFFLQHFTGNGSMLKHKVPNRKAKKIPLFIKRD